MNHFSKIFYFRRETIKSHFYIKKFFSKEKQDCTPMGHQYLQITTLY